jgi:nitrite reductase (NADH) small subunit/3-phenylpropionate/trans-cinnamate dioxygenase ferredoxin subunit
MAEFQTVCRLDEVGPGSAKAVLVSGKLIAIFNDQGSLYAIDDVCPHMGAALSEGYVENGIVTCSWHAWRFRLTDGAWADSPRIKIGCYPVRVQDGHVQLQLPDKCLDKQQAQP